MSEREEGDGRMDWKWKSSRDRQTDSPARDCGRRSIPREDGRTKADR